jgi:hypothetical protein
MGCHVANFVTNLDGHAAFLQIAVSLGATAWQQ